MCVWEFLYSNILPLTLEMSISLAAVTLLIIVRERLVLDSTYTYLPHRYSYVPGFRIFAELQLVPLANNNSKMESLWELISLKE